MLNKKYENQISSLKNQSPSSFEPGCSIYALFMKGSFKMGNKLFEENGK